MPEIRESNFYWLTEPISARGLNDDRSSTKPLRWLRRCITAAVMQQHISVAMNSQNRSDTQSCTVAGAVTCHELS